MIKISKIIKKIILFSLLLNFAACTHIYTRKGMYYRVGKGETLQTVASKYKVSVQELAEVNNIESSNQLREGRSLYIPGMTPKGLAHIIEKSRGRSRERSREKSKKPTSASTKKKPEKPSKNKNKQKNQPAPTDTASEDEIRIERDRFSWPIQGEISSPFGMRHGRRHDGIDIRSPVGTPIAAAGPGEVVFCKRMRGYGNLVLIRHKDDFFTVYAHNSVNLAKQGQKVKKGQIIAKVGRTGRATGPHLHFEVREGTKPRNPLFFLPKNEFAKRLNFNDLSESDNKDSVSDAAGEDHEGDADSEDTAEDNKPEIGETQKAETPPKAAKEAPKPDIKTGIKKEVKKKEAVKIVPKKEKKKVNRARTETKQKKETQRGRIKK